MAINTVDWLWLLLVMSGGAAGWWFLRRRLMASGGLRVVRALIKPLGLVIPLLLARAWLQARPATDQLPLLAHLASIALVAGVTWAAVAVIQAVHGLVLERIDLDAADNLQARKLATQIGVIKRLAIGLVLFLGSAAVLMTFDSVRQLGATLLASAGVAGVIIGFAAQRSLATIAAGLQIAFTQPIRIDDVVIVEGEWGRIEEITLTYVVIRIWDLRRLVVPITYFIERPFQNWTRVSADLLGTVTLQLDYQVDLAALRTELHRLLQDNPLWDGKVANVQVTDCDSRTMTVRVLISAADSGKQWDLRVFLREQLLDYLRREHPQAWGRYRVELPTVPTDTTLSNAPETTGGAEKRG